MGAWEFHQNIRCKFCKIFCHCPFIFELQFIWVFKVFKQLKRVSSKESSFLNNLCWQQFFLNLIRWTKKFSFSTRIFQIYAWTKSKIFDPGVTCSSSSVYSCCFWGPLFICSRFVHVVLTAAETFRSISLVQKL